MEGLIVLAVVVTLLVLLDVAAVTLGVDSRNFGPPGLD
jgi:hypothetical protein